DRQKMNLSKEVKSVTTFEYEAQGKAGHVIQGKLKYGNADAYNFSMFDTSGKLTEQKSLAKENTIFRRKVYQYNSKDTVINISVFNPDSELTEQVRYNRDKKGRVIEIRYLDEKAQLKKRFTQAYDDKNSTMERIERDEY